MNEKDYEDGFEEYIDGGIREEAAKNYRCAVDLYYKAVCQIIDCLLFKEDIIINTLKDRLGKIHVLNSELYDIFAIMHGIYRSAYKTKKDKKDCQEIKSGIKKIILLKRLEGRFKEAAERI